MATVMTTKYLLVLFAVIIGVNSAIKDAEYKFDTSASDIFHDVEIETDPGLHDRMKRQVDSPTTTATTTPEPAGTSTTTATPTTPTTTTTTTGPPTTSFSGDIDFINDTHRYYKSSTYRNLLGAHYYKEPSEFATRVHNALSDNHRTASTVTISFSFPFYGHGVTKITIATGGFLYMSPFLHQFLTATQYIAPLMANFDTTLGNNSRILYADTGSVFYVWWEGVILQDQPEAGEFTFQAQLHSNGQIIFAYKDIPRTPHAISTSEHPVKIGVSDAYYIDTDLQGNVKRRTIYEYHRVEIRLSTIQPFAAVKLIPEKLCSDQQDCRSCTTAEIQFDCVWCESMRRCSDGFDRHRQDFLESKCHLEHGIENESNCTDNSLAAGVLVAVILVIILFTALVIAVVAWFVYAYRHPNSKAGRWLIEHRPSQLRAQLSKVRFWKKDSGAGDKYAVSVGGESVA